MAIAAPPATAHLLFRPFTPEDLPLLRALNGDAKVRRHLYGVPEESETAAELQRYVDMQLKHGFTTWAVFEKETGAFVGRAGLKFLDAENERQLGFGVALGVKYWSSGYAREASQAVIDWAFANIADLKTLHTSVQADRLPARHALERSGFTLHEQVENPDGERWAIYTIERERAAGKAAIPIPR